MTEPVETELVARLRALLLRHLLATRDYNGCVAKLAIDAADEITRLQAELREVCHERDGFHAERDMARERLEWSPDQPYDGIAARDETIAGLQAELARVRKLGEAMSVEYGRAQHWMERAFADPDSLKDRLSIMDVFADQLERNRAALAAWDAEAGR